MFVSDGNVVYASHLDTETFQLVKILELSATLMQAQWTQLLKRQGKSKEDLLIPGSQQG